MSIFLVAYGVTSMVTIIGCIAFFNGIKEQDYTDVKSDERLIDSQLATSGNI